MYLKYHNRDIARVQVKNPFNILNLKRSYEILEHMLK